MYDIRRKMEESRYKTRDTIGKKKGEESQF